jgi:hypothetical protein
MSPGEKVTPVDGLAAGGYGLVGDIGQYEHIWRMAYERGPGDHRVPGRADRLTCLQPR